MSKVNERALPFADAATIVRAHQKDAYFESSYRSQFSEVLQFLKGQRFINSYPEEITVFTKSLYLVLTTLLGARTLGEEYVDLVYVHRSGTRLPRLGQRIGFILSYALIPYIISRLVKRLRPKDEDSVPADGGLRANTLRFLSSYHRILDTILNIHIALFYFKGEFYSLSKRLFGMRYAFGHNKEEKDLNRAGNYSLLGGIILLQYAVKSLIQLREYTDKETVSETKHSDKEYSVISDIDQLKLKTSVVVDLEDSKQLPYIPENSRTCMLCLSLMSNPSAANCGHIFCWDCIVDWIREHPECPLCRQSCVEQNLLPLR